MPQAAIGVHAGGKARQMTSVFPCIALFLLFVVTQAACEQGVPSAESLVAKDSAGVVIVMNAPDAIAEATSVTLGGDSLSIGRVGGPETSQLFQVHGVRQLSDGSLLVLNTGTAEVRRYDSSGQWLSSDGGPGDGPGEMRFPVSLIAGQADTSLVFDIGKQAYLVVDPGGQIVDSRPLPRRMGHVLGLIDSSKVIFVDASTPTRRYNAINSPRLLVKAVDLQTGDMDTILDLPGRQEYLYTRGDFVRDVPVPYSTWPTVRLHNANLYVVVG